MERPGQWPRGGHLRRGRDPALDPAWPAPVGHCRKPAVLDPDTTQLGKRAANAWTQLARALPRGCFGLEADRHWPRLRGPAASGRLASGRTALGVTKVK